MQSQERGASGAVDEDREVAREVVERMIDELRHEDGDHSKVVDHLDAVQKDLVDRPQDLLKVARAREQEQTPQHLMLGADVREAVDAGDFNVWAVKTVDEGIELLTGLEASERDEEGNYPEDSVNGRVARRLAELARRRKEFGPAPEAKGEED